MIKLHNIIPVYRKLDGVEHTRPYVFTVRAVEGVPWKHPAGRDYKSRVFYGPNDFDLICAAEESVDVTRDKHHIYLEGYEVVGDQSPGSVDQPGEIRIRFGS